MEQQTEDFDFHMTEPQLFLQMQELLEKKMQASIKESMAAMKTDLLKELAAFKEPAVSASRFEAPAPTYQHLFDEIKATLRRHDPQGEAVKERPASALRAGPSGKAGATEEQPSTSKGVKRKLSREHRLGSGSDHEALPEEDDISMASFVGGVSPGSQSPHEEFLLEEMASMKAIEEGQPLSNAKLAQQLGHIWLHPPAKQCALADG